MNRIALIFQNPMNWFWWLSIPLSWWVRTKLLTDNATDLKTLNSKQPILYVLPFRSISDLLVLYYHCRKLGFPLPVYTPNNLRKSGQAGYLYFSKLGLFQAKRSRQAPTPLQKLCVRMEKEINLNVQLVPVSIIWGRNPGSSEPSLFELLFPDDEHAGILQKLFIILAQGRNTLLHFGKPISLREQIDQGQDAEQVARKLRRVLRVHFRNQRNIALGPKTYDRSRVIRFVYDSSTVQNAIDAEASRSNTPRIKTEKKAWYYLKEISASQSPSMVRFFDVLLTYVWNKIYDGVIVRNAAGLRDVANDHEIVYMTSHRSHLDYLILPYELYYRGLTVPHSAAGVNLSFWPLGPILRRGGGFFIRRSFKGNRLYTIVFTEYLNYLITRGHSINFFPEGGRSRTGRLLEPRTGLLSMIIQGYLRDPAKPVAIIPVYVGYDKVAEVKSYLAELRGAAKKKEGIREFLKIWRVLTVKHGKAYIGFGKPLYINEYLDAASASWREKKADELQGKPKWFTSMVTRLAVDAMRGINDAVVVGPVSLLSVALLSSPQRAVALEDLDHTVSSLRLFLKHCFTNDEVATPTGTTKELLQYCEQIAPIQKFEYPEGGDVIYLKEIDSSLMVYYKNNIIHLFAYASLLAAYLQHCDEFEADQSSELAVAFHGFLQRDLFLNWSSEEASAKMNAVVSAFVSMGILSAAADGRSYERAEVTSQKFAVVNTLARLMSPLLDRYAVGMVMMQCIGVGKTLKKDEFERTLSAMTLKFALLKGISDPEVTNKHGFKSYFDILLENGYLKDADNGSFEVQALVERHSPFAEKLLDNDLLRNIKRQIT